MLLMMARTMQHRMTMTSLLFRLLQLHACMLQTLARAQQLTTGPDVPPAACLVMHHNYLVISYVLMGIITYPHNVRGSAWHT